MDTILKYFEKNGYQISNRYSSTFVTIFDEKIPIYIEEKTKLTSKKLINTYGNYEHYERKYTPTGKLSLIIDKYFSYGLKKHWKDKNNLPLENQVSEFIDGIFKYTKALRQERLKYKKQRQEEENKRKLEKYKIACEELENELILDLENQASNWRKSIELTKYIKEVEMQANQKFLNKKFPQELSDWLHWAKKHASNLNPFDNDLPKYVPAIKQLKREEIK